MAKDAKKKETAEAMAAEAEGESAADVEEEGKKSISASEGA